MDGIYATLFHFGERFLPSVSSIGVNPTFGAGPQDGGEFYLDFDGDIYGEAVSLSFVKRIRDEVIFSSVPGLIRKSAVTPTTPRQF